MYTIPQRKNIVNLLKEADKKVYVVKSDHLIDPQGQIRALSLLGSIKESSGSTLSRRGSLHCALCTYFDQDFYS
jgi:hypothetical protein